MLNKDITTFLRNEAKLYEAAVIKALRGKLLQNGMYASVAQKGDDRDVMRIVLGLVGAENTGVRAHAKKNIELVSTQGGKNLSLSKLRQEIINNLDKTIDENGTIDQRKFGVYMEQVGFDYAEEVLKRLFNRRTFSFKESGDQSGQDMNYDWSVRFRTYNNINGLTEEEKKKLQSGIRFEHKNTLNNFHIGNGTLDKDYVERWINNKGGFLNEELSLQELTVMYILLAKFSNNYPIFFSVKDQNFLFSSDILDNPNLLYLKDFQPSGVDIEREAKQMYLDSLNIIDEDEMEIYISSLKKNKALYNEFEKDVIEHSLMNKMVKGSLWYGKK